VSRLDDDAARFAERLLQQEAVAVTPGLDFGMAASGRYLRFAYTQPPQRLDEAATRIRRLLRAGA